jgi:diguanylate cyclase (GGDEF)-like protein
MSLFSRLVFGDTQFGESEEFKEFRYKFLCAVMLSCAFFTLLFLVGTSSGVNTLAPAHVRAMAGFTVSTLLMWWLLRGHAERFLTIAWCYEVLCLLEDCSALIHVSEDEMRIIWLLTNIPAVYILLGQRAGLLISVITLSAFAFGNAYLDRPYSTPALATSVIGGAYLTVFFHVYGDRAVSYFSRMRESYDKLRYMAEHDPLTGVFNARAYYEACERLILLAARTATPYAVMFVDLDHFKSINDTYGHAAGDAVLKAVAQALSQTVRKSDLVGRVGGEEFSIFLPGTDLEGAMRLAETLRQSIERLMPSVGAQALKVTASIGVARSRHSEVRMQDIQARADQAMYLAKRQGRNRVSVVDERPPPDAVPHAA